MRVWITRSEPGASRQADTLRQSGIEVVVVPVLGIEPTGAPPPRGPFDVVIFLSEHAVRHGGDLAYCRGARVCAVGASTARALAAAGIQAEVPGVAASEGLLELLADGPMKDAAVLIVAGEEGRKRLRDSLMAKDARVTEFLCYRRQPVAATAPADVDAVLIGSQDGFRAFARLWFDSGRGPVRVIAASERVAGIGPALGFADVEVAGGAGTDDWIEALHATREAREAHEESAREDRTRDD